MPFGMEVSLGPGDFVFDEDPATPREKGTTTPTQFLVHVYCGQTAGWIKMPFGTEVHLSPPHIVLDGVPALRKRDIAALLFSAHVYCGQTAGWLKMPLGTEIDLGPDHIVLDATQLRPPPQKGTQQSLSFRSMSI